MASKHLKQLAVSALLLACGAASAQLGNGGGKYEGVDKGRINPQQVVDHFVETTQSLLGADNRLLAAVGLPDLAAKASAEANALASNMTRAQFESALNAQAEVGQALQQKLAAKAALDDGAKLQFSSAVGQYADGLIVYAGLSRDLIQARKTMSNTGGAASSATYLAKALPGAVKDMGATLKAAVDYAKANNITLPPSAAEALAQL